jgi:hypothetical protein
MAVAIKATNRAILRRGEADGDGCLTTGALALSAGLGTDPAVLMMIGVLLAFLGAKVRVRCRPPYGGGPRVREVSPLIGELAGTHDGSNGSIWP